MKSCSKYPKRSLIIGIFYKNNLGQDLIEPIKNNCKHYQLTAYIVSQLNNLRKNELFLPVVYELLL